MSPTYQKFSDERVFFLVQTQIGLVYYGEGKAHET
jgi:hypothetical protein